MVKRFDVFAAAILIGFMAFQAGCQSSQSRTPAVSRVLPLPTKDQLLLVDGNPVSISDYMSCRAIFPGAKKEYLVHILTRATLVSADAQKRGVKLSLDDSVALVRYSTGEVSEASVSAALLSFAGDKVSPPDLNLRISSLLARAVVQINSRVLSELR